VTHPLSRYVPLLIDGDLEGLLDLFGNTPRINDPRLGWVEGAAFELFVAASSEGLAERQARVEHLTTTSTARGAVEECILSLVRGVVGRYHERLAVADLGGTVAQFEAAGAVREPAGERLVHRGRVELQRFYGRLLARGGISVERCSLTDDGSSCALEYNLTTWGDSFLPHQAGIAVYERARSGFLAAVRLYDDIERPPPPS
jgi:hypothetical protein